MFRAEVGLRKLRIGVVSYLNAMPLWYALRHEQDIELVPDTPARLAAAMAAGELDVGLLPVVEALRDPELSFFPDLGVGADGVVESVGLFTREDLPALRTVALTQASRTSVALTRVILHAAGAAPEYVDAPVDANSLAERTEDAVLLIGDECLRAHKSPSDRVFVDLAAEWRLLTDLPFVFAVWAGPRRALTGELHARLQEALQAGREIVHDFVRYAAMDTGWSEEALGKYLSETIQHELSPDHMKGLLEFTRRAAALGLVPREAVDKVLGVIAEG